MAMKARIGMLALLPTLATLFGCEILAPFYLAAIMMGYDQRVPPAFEFPEDAKRIVVVTYTDLSTQTEFGHVDQELNDVLSRMLFQGFDQPKNALTEKKRGIQVIKASKVAKWQDEHHDWTSMDPAEIGKALKADYVIYVEVGKLTMYEDGPSQILYRGHADVTLSVVRVENEEVVLPSETVSIYYPKDRPIPVSGDIPPTKFRREFIRRMAERLSWYFLPHESGEEFEKTPV
jgi:hypothetical protein